MKKTLLSICIPLFILSGCSDEDKKNIIPDSFSITNDGISIVTDGKEVFKINEEGLKVDTPDGKIAVGNEGVHIQSVRVGENITTQAVEITNPLIENIFGIFPNENNNNQNIQAINYQKGSLNNNVVSVQTTGDNIVINENNKISHLFASKKQIEDFSVIEGEKVISPSISCEKEYEKLLSVDGFDFAKCTKTNIRSGSFSETTDRIEKVSMVIIFDSSGSMASIIDGKSRMEIAKKAVRKFLRTLDGDKNIDISLLVYGHKGNNSSATKSLSCNGIDQLISLAPVNSLKIESAISSFTPTGWTPIGKSLEKAYSILSSSSDKNKYILLISDGKETCDGNPLEVVSKIKELDSTIKINVIGLDVLGDDESQLKAISEVGNGEYYDVRSLLEFENALKKNKKMLDKVDYAIGRTVDQIYDISYLTNTYFQCSAALKREESAIMIDTYSKNIIPNQCKNYIITEYKKRFEEINEIITENYIEGKKEFTDNNQLMFVK